LTKTILILVIAAAFVAGSATTGWIASAQIPSAADPFQSLQDQIINIIDGNTPVGTSSDVNCTTPCIDEAELTFDTANQDELDTHTANAAAHHDKYTNAEAVTAVGPHTDLGTIPTEILALQFVSHEPITVTNIQNFGFELGPHAVDTTLTEVEVDAFVANNGFSLGPHYTDADAIAAVGAHTSRYTDTEAVNAVGPHTDLGTIPTEIAALQLISHEPITVTDIEGFGFELGPHTPDTDTDPTNELQTLSLSGNDLTLSQGGGTITLPTGVDQSAEIAVLQAQVAALELLVTSMSVDGNNVIFTGVNLQILDGTDSTACTGSCNGLGNLIVGYDELRPTTNDKTGSHNLVIGPRHNYPSYGGLVTGFENTISGAHSSVSGGQNNVASEFASSVSGGRDNEASAFFSSVSGGLTNVASGLHSSVSGGQDNDASGSRSSVSGGRLNDAIGENSSVSGGLGNEARGTDSSVSGGNSNEAIGPTSSVSGGQFNKASGTHSSVSGGDTNEAIGPESSVSGGNANDAIGENSSVSGGALNDAIGVASSVSGGFGRTAPGGFDWVAGTLFENISFEIPEMITKSFASFFNL